MFTSVLVRCDVGPSIGVGHVMRCVALAEELQARGAAVTFAADVASVPFAAAQVAARGFAVAAPPGTPEEHAGLVRSTGADLVVIDSYLLPREVYAAVRETGVLVLAIVDGDPSGRSAHLYVDQNIGAEDDTWDLPEGSLRLAGLDYALMRDEIRAVRPAALPGPRPGVPEVFAVFGGTDAYGAAPVATRALVATGQPFRLTVVAGQDRLRAELEQIAATGLARGQSVTVIPPTVDLASRVLAADVVVSAAGSSSWELLCLGAATGLVCVADNQEVSYSRIIDHGLAVGLGYLDAMRSGSDTGAGPLATLLATPARRQQLRLAAWSAVDGRGRERVVDACEAHGAPR